MTTPWKSNTRNIILALAALTLIPVAAFIMKQSNPFSVHFPTGVPALILSCLMAAAFVWYCICLYRFTRILTDENDRNNMKKVLYGNILLVVGTIVMFILVSIFIYINSDSAILSFTTVNQICSLLIMSVPVISYIKMRKGYYGLSKSPTLNDTCRSGFGYLCNSAEIKIICMITAAAGSLICNIILKFGSMPLITKLEICHMIVSVISLANIILLGVSIVRIFKGWKLIRQSPPPAETEQ